VNTTEKVNADEIAIEKQKADSVRTIIVYRDSIRTKVVTKWKEIRYDSLIPCETKLLICDTVIKVDSTLIRELKTTIKIDSCIIEGQDKLIRADSLTIKDLIKTVKKEKRKRRLITVIAIVIAGLGIAK
jgi:hypothetical protein